MQTIHQADDVGELVRQKPGVDQEFAAGQVGEFCF